MTNKTRAPALFIGHGSPMNAIEDNVFSRTWQGLSAKFAKPEAILSISAHWYTRGLKICDAENPETIYDMYGFPEDLYKIVYDAPGAPALAHEAIRLVDRPVAVDNSWGLDHGTWSVLHRMYPDADIPVVQLSVDAGATPQQHFQLGRQLAGLRDQGVLILGSGNVVHNLMQIDWGLDAGYPWAEDFDLKIKKRVLARDYRDVVSYAFSGKPGEIPFPTLDHYFPLLPVLGASDEQDNLEVFNDVCLMGSMSMTSYLFNRAV